jgi:hypothetical protein
MPSSPGTDGQHATNFLEHSLKISDLSPEENQNLDAVMHYSALSM